MLEKKLIFISGKGGTGKSTLALCLARKLSLLGKRTLLVELGEKSSVASLADWKLHGTYLPQKTPLGFDWSLIRGIDCLSDYVGSFVKVEKLAQYFFNNPFMRTLLDIAPGLDDLAILGKLTSHIRHHGPAFHYDHIVIDSHSTGSFLSMLQAPQWLSQMVSSGPLHTQSLQIAKTLKDPNVVGALFVSILEELPVDELLESTAEYEKYFGKNYSVVINKYLPQIEVSSGDEVWKKFFLKKLEEQKKMEERVQNEYGDIVYQNLITSPLSSFLQKTQPGELLFH